MANPEKLLYTLGPVGLGFDHGTVPPNKIVPFIRGSIRIPNQQ